MLNARTIDYKEVGGEKRMKYNEYLIGNGMLFIHL